MSSLPGPTAAAIHDHLQAARSAAAGVEDPSVRRALDALADATAALTKALRDQGG